MHLLDFHNRALLVVACDCRLADNIRKAEYVRVDTHIGYYYLLAELVLNKILHTFFSEWLV